MELNYFFTFRFHQQKCLATPLLLENTLDFAGAWSFGLQFSTLIAMVVQFYSQFIGWYFEENAYWRHFLFQYKLQSLLVKLQCCVRKVERNGRWTDSPIEATRNSRSHISAQFNLLSYVSTLSPLRQPSLLPLSSQFSLRERPHCTLSALSLPSISSHQPQSVLLIFSQACGHNQQSTLFIVLLLVESYILSETKALASLRWVIEWVLLNIFEYSWVVLYTDKHY